MHVINISSFLKCHELGLEFRFIIESKLNEMRAEE